MIPIRQSESYSNDSNKENQNCNQEIVNAQLKDQQIAANNLNCAQKNQAQNIQIIKISPFPQNVEFQEVQQPPTIMYSHALNRHVMETNQTGQDDVASINSDITKQHHDTDSKCKAQQYEPTNFVPGHFTRETVIGPDGNLLTKVAVRQFNIQFPSDNDSISIASAVSVNAHTIQQQQNRRIVKTEIQKNINGVMMTQYLIQTCSAEEDQAIQKQINEDIAIEGETAKTKAKSISNKIQTQTQTQQIIPPQKNQEDNINGVQNKLQIRPTQTNANISKCPQKISEKNNELKALQKKLAQEQQEYEVRIAKENRMLIQKQIQEQIEQENLRKIEQFRLDQIREEKEELKRQFSYAIRDCYLKFHGGTGMQFIDVDIYFQKYANEHEHIYFDTSQDRWTTERNRAFYLISEKEQFQEYMLARNEMLNMHPRILKCYQTRLSASEYHQRLTLYTSELVNSHQPHFNLHPLQMQSFQQEIIHRNQETNYYLELSIQQLHEYWSLQHIFRKQKETHDKYVQGLSEATRKGLPQQYAPCGLTLDHNELIKGISYFPKIVSFWDAWVNDPQAQAQYQQSLVDKQNQLQYQILQEEQQRINASIEMNNALIRREAEWQQEMIIARRQIEIQYQMEMEQRRQVCLVEIQKREEWNRRNDEYHSVANIIARYKAQKTAEEAEAKIQQNLEQQQIQLSQIYHQSIIDQHFIANQNQTGICNNAIQEQSTDIPIDDMGSINQQLQQQTNQNVINMNINQQTTQDQQVNWQQNAIIDQLTQQKQQFQIQAINDQQQIIPPANIVDQQQNLAFGNQEPHCQDNYSFQKLHKIQPIIISEIDKTELNMPSKMLQQNQADNHITMQPQFQTENKSLSLLNETLLKSPSTEIQKTQDNIKQIDIGLNQLKTNESIEQHVDQEQKKTSSSKTNKQKVSQSRNSYLTCKNAIVNATVNEQQQIKQEKIEEQINLFSFNQKGHAKEKSQHNNMHQEAYQIYDNNRYTCDYQYKKKGANAGKRMNQC